MAGPCASEYTRLLTALKSNPTTDAADYIYSDGAAFAPRRFKTPQYGPDDAISLKAVLESKAARGSRFDGIGRVGWMLDNIESLVPTADAINDRRCKIQQGSLQQALREVLGA